MEKTEKELHVLQEASIANEQLNYTPPKQSANVLFTFMKRLDFLKETIEKKAITPRYYEENIDYLNLPNLDKIAFPMSCFCDIHLNKLVYHMENYEKYGIGINKDWA